MTILPQRPRTMNLAAARASLNAPPRFVSTTVRLAVVAALHAGGEEKEHDFFRDAMNDLYARGDSDKLGVFRRLVEELYPTRKAPGVFERQRIAESAVRTVYIHSHMDEDTFDCTRAMLCPDQVPTEPGRFVPACVYNLFDRMKDERFYVQV